MIILAEGEFADAGRLRAGVARGKNLTDDALSSTSRDDYLAYDLKLCRPENFNLCFESEMLSFLAEQRSHSIFRGGLSFRPIPTSPSNLDGTVACGDVPGS